MSRQAHLLADAASRRVPAADAADPGQAAGRVGQRRARPAGATGPRKHARPTGHVSRPRRPPSPIGADATATSAGANSPHDMPSTPATGPLTCSPAVRAEQRDPADGGRAAQVRGFRRRTSAPSARGLENSPIRVSSCPRFFLALHECSVLGEEARNVVEDAAPSTKGRTSTCTVRAGPPYCSSRLAVAVMLSGCRRGRRCDRSGVVTSL